MTCFGTTICAYLSLMSRFSFKKHIQETKSITSHVIPIEQRVNKINPKLALIAYSADKGNFRDAELVCNVCTESIYLICSISFVNFNNVSLSILATQNSLSISSVREAACSLIMAVPNDVYPTITKIIPNRNKEE